MSDGGSSRLARQAWSRVFLIVVVVAIMASSLLWIFGLPAFLAAAISALLFTAFAFLVQLGYYVSVPTKDDMVKVKSRQELAKLADYLCLDPSGDSAELRRSIEEFVAANGDRPNVWVAPGKMTESLRALRLLPSGRGPPSARELDRKATERVNNSGP